jgi:ATP-binding cassette subfamily C (CFTR/MRP) protein 1
MIVRLDLPIGLAILMVLLPMNAIVWNWMEKAQVKQMREKDERVRVITEVLGGIKVIKLYAWENSFVKKIEALRATEIGFLKRMQVI